MSKNYGIKDFIGMEIKDSDGNVLAEMDASLIEKIEPQKPYYSYYISLEVEKNLLEQLREKENQDIILEIEGVRHLGKYKVDEESDLNVKFYKKYE